MVLISKHGMKRVIGGALMTIFFFAYLIPWLFGTFPLSSYALGSPDWTRAFLIYLGVLSFQGWFFLKFIVKADGL